MFVRGAFRATALWVSLTAVAHADLVDYEIVDLEIHNYQGNTCTANVAFVGQPSCITLTVRNNGPSHGVSGYTATLRFQDPGGLVVIVESREWIDGQPITLANHSYHPTQPGVYEVSCSLRPTSTVDEDRNPANNSRVETYEVTTGPPAFFCEYDSNTGELQYSVSGAPTGWVYTVSGVAGVPLVFDGIPPNLVGPADNASVRVSCQAAGNGLVRVTVSDGISTYDLCSNSCLRCSGPGAVPVPPCLPTGQPVPVARSFVLAALGAILVGLGAARLRSTRGVLD